VVVAIIQYKEIEDQAEKGFRRTMFEPELVGPNLEINFVKSLEAGFPAVSRLTGHSQQEPL